VRLKLAEVRLRDSGPPSHELPREFLSPDRRRIARFGGETEFRMGCYAYTLVVTEAGSPKLRQLETANGPYFLLPEAYQPWAWDSCSLLSVPLSIPGPRPGGPVLIDLDGDAVHELPLIRGAARVAVCSDRKPLAFIAQGDQAECYSIEGSPRPLSTHMLSDDSLAWWLPDGEHLLALVQKDGKSSLIVFDSGSSLPVAGIEFTPRVILPFDDTPFRDLPKDQYSLGLGRGTRAVGGLMDMWSRVSFDPDAMTLTMRVLRPVGPVAWEGSNWTCPAREIWADGRLEVEG
jgi:hypothetical protein